MNRTTRMLKDTTYDICMIFYLEGEMKEGEGVRERRKRLGGETERKK